MNFSVFLFFKILGISLFNKKNFWPPIATAPGDAALAIAQLASFALEATGYANTCCVVHGSPSPTVVVGRQLWCFQPLAVFYFLEIKKNKIKKGKFVCLIFFFFRKKPIKFGQLSAFVVSF